MIIREVQAKSILSKSTVFDYALNPYTGCQYGCSYCYARFMKRFSRHKEDWGEFIDVKINAPSLLKKELMDKKRGRVWVSGVCDPYQPVEARYELTKKCLGTLIQHDWPICIQTKSPLILRDINLIQKSKNIEAGLTITTGDERIMQLFEPRATSVEERINALEQLHLAGIKTYAMIAPLLPGAEKLIKMLKGKVGYIIIDKMNYHYSDWIYRKYKIASAKSKSIITQASYEIFYGFEKQGIECKVLFNDSSF
jgi:DNA repair photolyase